MRMKLFMLSKSKGQISVLEFMLGISITMFILLVFVYMFDFLTLKSSFYFNEKRLFHKSDSLAHLIFTPGNEFALTSSYGVLDWSKLELLSTTPYNEERELLGLGDVDFELIIKNYTNSKKIYSYGNVSKEAVVSYYALMLLNSSIVEVHLKVSK